MALTKWHRARSRREKRHLSDALFDAALHADRPDVAEQAIAGGPLGDCEITFRQRSRCVPLRVVKTFEEIEVEPEDLFAQAPNEGDHWYSAHDRDNHWLARRMTTGALEVWTPKHGWLFDGQGALLNEAVPPRRDGAGREWYGAFLPDGCWVTTDLSDTDHALSFFSRAGEFLKRMPSEELAPSGSEYRKNSLLGWGRSDKDGAAWIVNVGSEEGYATIRVGPEGPARVLSGTERWRLCYPRALGARGWYIAMWVPDDSDRVLLKREEAGHGAGVGYPSYALAAPKTDAVPDDLDASRWLCSVPNGNAVFGFWPGRRDIYVGALRLSDERGVAADTMSHGWNRTSNATWFFTSTGRFRGWLQGRRLADAADRRAMLFRLERDARVVTLRPDLDAVQVRRFVWTDGGTATALSLFDDLRLGLFSRDGKLVLASWDER